MTKTVQSTALVLRRIPHRETSLIVQVFTRDFGRIHFLAKGARSGGKRAPVPLIPVALLELLWAPSQRSELQLLRETSLINGFGNIHKDFARLMWAQAALECLSRALKPEDMHTDLFDATVEYLEVLNNLDSRWESLFFRFRLTMMKELGYEIDTSEPEGQGSALAFLPSKGKAIRVQNTIGPGVPVKLGTWKLLHAISESPLENLSRLRLPADAVKEIHILLDASARAAFDHWAPLKSLNLMASIEKQ